MHVCLFLDSFKEIHNTEVSDTHITTPDSPSSFQKDSDLGYEFQQRSLQSGLAETHGKTMKMIGHRK